MQISLTGPKSCATYIAYNEKGVHAILHMTQPPEDMIKKTLTYLTLLAAAGLAHAAETFHQGPFNPAEKALVKKGYYMEVFETDKPSGHMLGKIGTPGKPTNDVVIFNFGIEDSQAARAEGRSMRAFNYAPAQAQTS